MTQKVFGLGRAWAWPDDDTECLKVVFSWLGDLTRAVRFCKKHRTAIQAGGNMGVWPYALSRMFDYVVTAEPDPACFALLKENLCAVSNVDAYPVAFLEGDTRCDLHLEKGNRGAQYVEHTPAGSVQAVSIDSLVLRDVDLIYLDIEGAEWHALHGARNTIQECKPVIAYEDKHLSDRFSVRKGDTEKWLAAEYGYEVVARYHNDVVLSCG